MYKGINITQKIQGVKENKSMVKDHLGNEYRSIKIMCEYYNRSVQTYYYRIKSGYTLEQALILRKEDARNVAKTKFVNCQNPVDEEERVDHLGNVHPSKTAMCEFHGISRHLYHYRRNVLGWSVEVALCTPVERKILSKKKRTINGTVYKNVVEIKKEIFNNEISERVLYGFLTDCESTEEAIKKAKSVIRQRKMREMRKKILKRNGLNELLYNSRISRGWSMVNALTIPKLETLLKEGRTFDGVTYSNIEKMCIAHGMNPTAYLQRISRGVSKEIALLTPINDTKSMQEKEIDRLLSRLIDVNKIDKYAKGYTFAECKDKSKLPFDFFVVKNNKIGIIEFDGQQHFVPNCFWSLEEAVSRGYKDINEAAQKEFEIIRKHDLIKNKFCKENKIPLLRIRYSQSSHKEQMIEDFIEELNTYSERFNPYITNEEYYIKK